VKIQISFVEKDTTIISDVVVECDSYKKTDDHSVVIKDFAQGKHEKVEYSVKIKVSAPIKDINII